jgi:hypothetical protein
MKKEKEIIIKPSDYSPLTKLQDDFSDLKKVLKKLLNKIENNGEAWEITIKSEPDCYILNGNVEGTKRTWVIEENEKDILEMHERLLHEVIEFFGIQGSRYDKERITVVRKRGDKCEK